MAYSYVTYTGDASTQIFTIPFPYIARADVKVYLDGVLKTVDVDYTFLSNSSIQFVAAPGSGVVIRIARDTQKTSRLVDFQDASILTEASLDLDSNQLMYITQEGYDNNTDALKKNVSGVYDAENRRIVNVATPVDNADVATKGWSESAGSSFVGAAAASAAAAASSESNASTSAANASTSAANAATSETNAAASASTATTKAGEASTSATNAANSASAAATSATNAGNSATAAAGSASSASTSATNASNSASAAATSATNAASSATAAATSATEAAASAAAASIAGKQTIWIPAGAMVPGSFGAAPGTAVMPTSGVVVKSLDFDSAAFEYAQFTVAMPKSWNEGTLTVKFIWSHPSTSVNFGVVWAIAATGFGNDDLLQTAFNTAVEVSDTGGTTDDLYASNETAAITVQNAAENDVVVFRIYRDVNDAGDTMAVDARLHGVVLFYTTDANTDA